MPSHNLDYALIADHIAVNNLRDIMSTTEEYLIETADRCKRLARTGREVADSLEAISNDLMAKAVQLDTNRDKTKNKKFCG